MRQSGLGPSSGAARAGVAVARANATSAILYMAWSFMEEYRTATARTANSGLRRGKKWRVRNVRQLRYLTGPRDSSAFRFSVRDEGPDPIGNEANRARPALVILSVLPAAARAHRALLFAVAVRGEARGSLRSP